MTRFVSGFVLGMFGVAALAWAQVPAMSAPNWVMKYTVIQEQSRRMCEISLAQEQTNIDKLTKELADSKAALAKLNPAALPKPPEENK